MTALYSVLTALTFFIMPAQTTLFAQDMSAVVDLPTGYFVLKSDTYAPDGYISVVYDDLTGYVKADAVTQVDYTPVYKYETKVKFNCDNDGQPVNVRSKPTKSAEILTVLPANGSGRCYGPTRGDALISGAGTTWYYVNVNGVKGYCYYAHVAVDPTPPNIIEKEDPPADKTNTTPTTPADTEQKSMSTTAAIIFIVALCIPVPFIMYYLFRKPKDE